MKAVILAAGLGKRLIPYTKTLPKPLFPIDDKPIIGIIIEKLIFYGCKSIYINTHHLNHKIEDFINQQNYKIPVSTIYEPIILGTGGAIKNISDKLSKKPFILINSDIITDINLKDVYDFHIKHKYLVTMVLHNYKKFNNVIINNKNFIIDFHKTNKLFIKDKLAFTGIHIIDPKVLDYIPKNCELDIIDIYKKLLKNNIKIKAKIIKKKYWIDIGTPKLYLEAVVSYAMSQEDTRTEFEPFLRKFLNQQ